MSMTALQKSIDDDFLPECRQKAALTEFLPKVQGDQYLPQGSDSGHWKAAHEWRGGEADGIAAAPLRYFGELANDNGVFPEDHERKYWEDYWMKSLAVNRLWPEPAREFKVKQFAHDWWCVLKVMDDQKVPAWPGQPTATVQKAFSTNTLQSVFPLFFDTNIVAGILASPVLDRIVARSISVNSHTATHLKMTETDGDATMGETGELATFVQLIVKEAERTVKLRKFGGELNWSYEVMRLQRLDVLALSIQRIGLRYSQLKTDLALSVLIDDQSDGEGAITDSAATTTGSPNYQDLLNAEFLFPYGYHPDTIIAPKEILKKLLGFAEFKDPLAGILHQTTGRMPNPLGIDLVRWDSTGRVSTYLATTAIMLDSNLALVEYTEGGIITESERVIKSQMERSVTSQWVGYAKWDHNAAIRLTGW